MGNTLLDFAKIRLRHGVFPTLGETFSKVKYGDKQVSILHVRGDLKEVSFEYKLESSYVSKQGVYVRQVRRGFL